MAGPHPGSQTDKMTTRTRNGFDLDLDDRHF
jgi:hypothetical protein